MSLGLLGILVSLALLITLAYRGHSVLVAAPVAALVATLFAGAPLLGTYTQVFMPAMATFLGSYFPLFLTGAVFGHLMKTSGLAGDFAAWASQRLGAQHAVLITVLTTAALTYGGVSAWVVVFTIFPIATQLFREAGIPRRLMPAAVALGVVTFALGALPGSPQIHNTIPTTVFGTTTFAAPVLGLLTGALVFGLGMAWLRYRQRSLMAAGESFEDLTIREREAGVTVAGGTDRPAERGRVSTASGLLGLVPVAVVVAVQALMTYLVIPRLDTAYLADEKYGAVTLASVAGIWAVTVAMVVAILVVVLLRPGGMKHYPGDVSEGAGQAVLPTLTTANEVGFGAVIASMAAFTVIRDGIFGLTDNPVVTAAVSTAGISGVTGSASGGLQITMSTFGEQLAAQGAAQGIDPEVLHRVAALASTSFDSMPHNGAIITMLLVTGLTHREAYKDIFAVTVVGPLIGTAVAVVMGLTVGAF